VFRKEALEAKKGNALGAVIAISPISTSILVVLSTAIAVCLVLFFIFGSYTKRVKVFGQLIPAQGLVKIYAPQAGTIIKNMVTEGQLVKRGDVLFGISSERYDEVGVGAQEDISLRVKGRLKLLHTEHEKLRAVHMEELQAQTSSVENMKRSVERYDSQILLQRKRVALAKDSVSRYKDLIADKYVSRDQYHEKQEIYLDQAAKLQELLQQRSDAAKDLAKQQSDLRSLPLKQAATIAQLERETLATSQELLESEAKRSFAIVAPEDGVVATTLAEAGQHIEPNKVLLNIVPSNATLVADIYIKSKDIGFTHIGDKTLVRYAAYPYQKFGTQSASVISMSAVAVPASEIAVISGTLPGLDQNAPQDLYYRATLALGAQTILAYGARERLVPGMILEVDILREKRAIYEWLLEPLYSLSGRVS